MNAKTRGIGTTVVVFVVVLGLFAVGFLTGYGVGVSVPADVDGLPYVTVNGLKYYPC